MRPVPPSFGGYLEFRTQGPPSACACFRPPVNVADQCGLDGRPSENNSEETAMKVTMFHFMPYRDLPDSFPDKLHSAWIDAPWWEYGDANKVTDVYNWSVDELMLAAKLGF